MSEPLWYPPEADGSPGIVGPGGWHEHTFGQPCPYRPDALIKALLDHEREEQSFPERAPRRVSSFDFALTCDANPIVAYRLACPEARRLEARVAELEGQAPELKKQSVAKSLDDVMFAFFVEPQQDATTLARYINAYPQFAPDLVDLAHEMNLSVSLGPIDAPLEDDAKARAAWLQYAAVRPNVVASEEAQAASNVIQPAAAPDLLDEVKRLRAELVAIAGQTTERTP